MFKPSDNTFTIYMYIETLIMITEQFVHNHCRYFAQLTPYLFRELNTIRKIINFDHCFMIKMK